VTVGEAAAARVGGQCREIAQPCRGAAVEGPTQRAQTLAADLLLATRRENTMLIGVMHLLFAWATVAAALGVIARMR
jgi:hypothetical protein